MTDADPGGAHRLAMVPGPRAATAATSGVDWLNRGLLVAVGALVLIPVATLVFGAFTSEPPRAPNQEFTLLNVSRALTSTEVLVPLGNSLLLGAIVGLTSLVAGSAIAFVIARMRIRWARLWENFALVPVYISPLMLALSAVALFAPRVGFVNQLMPDPEFFNIYSFWGIVWVLTVNYSGLVFLYMIGPMRSLNTELEEAAAVLGGSRLNILRRIVIPLLRPSALSTYVVVFILAAEEFAVPSMLGRQSGFRTLPNEIYYLLTYDPTNPNLAAALGLVLLVIAMLGIALYRRLTRNAARYVTMSGKYRAAASFGPRKLRGLPEVGLAVWVVLAIVLPFVGLILGSFLRFITPNITPQLFTLMHYERVFSGTGLHLVRNTLVLALLAATIVAFLGAVISYGLRFGRGPARGVLDYLSMATLAIPASALAVGLLWAYVGLPGAIWGSIWILLIAYVTRAIAHGVRATNNSIAQVSPQLDEAAQVLGAGLFRRLRTIQLPIMSHGIRSAWIVVFVYAVNEVTASALLFSTQSETVAVRVWNSVQMFGAAQAFAYAVVQGVMVAVVLLVFNLVFGRREARSRKGLS